MDLEGLFWAAIATMLFLSIVGFVVLYFHLHLVTIPF